MVRVMSVLFQIRQKWFTHIRRGKFRQLGFFFKPDIHAMVTYPNAVYAKKNFRANTEQEQIFSAENASIRRNIAHRSS